MTTPQESAADLPPEGMAFVWDATATRGPRTHEIGGRNVTFPDADNPVPVPLAAARGISHISTFKVIGPAGERYLPTTAAPIDDAPSTPRLRNDQVVASLDELTQQALRERAKAWEGHDDFDQNANKGGLVKFIMDRQAEQPTPAEGDKVEVEGDYEAPTRDDDGEVEAVTKADLAAIGSKRAA